MTAGALIETTVGGDADATRWSGAVPGADSASPTEASRWFVTFP